MKLRIKRGRLVDPFNNIDEVRDVYIADRVIAGTGRSPSGFTADEEINAQGLVVCPGFVDLGARLREPGYEYKATLASELRAAAAGGFTSVCCTPDTDPVIDNDAVVESVLRRARSLRTVRLYCIGALTRNLDGQVLSEMGALRDAGCIAVSNVDSAVMDTHVLRQALTYAAGLEMTVFMHSEDPWLARQGVMHEGEISARLGLPGIPVAAEAIGLSRDLALIAESGVHAHIRGISSAPAVRLLRDARRQGLPVSSDVALANLCLSEENLIGYDPNYHLRPPLRAKADRRALTNALANSAIDAICADHQPHDKDAKSAPFSATESGASMFDTLLPKLLSLQSPSKLPLGQLIRAMTIGPAQILGLNAGHLSRNAPADVCIFDPDHEWLAHPDNFVSVGKNSPFLNEMMRGKAVITIVDGRVVYRADI
ncbi:MAG: dihydroorotase [Pseudomonadota bacterium]